MADQIGSEALQRGAPHLRQASPRLPCLSTLSCRFPDISPWRIIRDVGYLSRADLPRLLWADDSGAMSVLVNEPSTTTPIFVLRFNRIAQFELRVGSQEILVSTLSDDVSEQTIHHLLIDQVWPRIIAYHGRLVLHAAGVSTVDGAILFVGQSGLGKSTLAASLHQRGFSLHGDDAMVMSADGCGTRCSAVYRSLRLFPDSIATLFEESLTYSQVADYSDKQNVHLAAPSHRNDDDHVRAIFFIEPEQAHSRATVTEVSPAAACMRMVEHSFWLDPTDLVLTAQKLHAASAVANCVPAFKLAYPRDFTRFGELHSTIFSVLG